MFKQTCIHKYMITTYKSTIDINIAILTPDTSTKIAKLVKWVVEHCTNVLFASLCMIPSVENLPLRFVVLCEECKDIDRMEFMMFCWHYYVTTGTLSNHT